MNGVEIMADIMNYILDNSFKAVNEENKAMEENILTHNPMQTIEEHEHDDSRTYDTPLQGQVRQSSELTNTIRASQ